MAECALSWMPRSPWAGLLPSDRFVLGGAQAGVSVAPRDNLRLATVIARRGNVDELQAKLVALYGIEAPPRPVIVHGRGLDLAWAGPEQWLAVSADRAIADRLAGELKGLAAVSDQSGGRAVLRLSGPKLREALAKGCPVDLHPRMFCPGDTAITAIAHMGVHLWQVDDAPTFDVLVARSMAGSFWRWFSASAREFGLDLRASSA